MTDIVDWLTLAEQEKLLADVRKMSQEFDNLAAWLKSPEGQVWAEQQMKEAATLAEEFAAEAKAGKFDLTPAELEQLNRDGFLRKCHPIKRGGKSSG